MKNGPQSFILPFPLKPPCSLKQIHQVYSFSMNLTFTGKEGKLTQTSLLTTLLWDIYVT